MAKKLGKQAKNIILYLWLGFVATVGSTFVLGFVKSWAIIGGIVTTIQNLPILGPSVVVGLFVMLGAFVHSKINALN